MSKVPLKVLVIDSDEQLATTLVNLLTDLADHILVIQSAVSINDALVHLKKHDFNTIFIDPLALGVDPAVEFIFRTRKRYPSIVFVLFVNFDNLLEIRDTFFAGDRKRFKHYYKLNKMTPSEILQEEVVSVVTKCQKYLSYSLTEETIQKLQNELNKIEIKDNSSAAEEIKISVQLLNEINNQLKMLTAQKHEDQFTINTNSVFLSYRFAEIGYIDGLRTLLEREGFTVITGKENNTYIGRAIISKIKSAEFFLSLMTKADKKNDGSFTTSAWLLEEKGAALAFEKKIVLMVEDGVNDFGGLQGDWQRIHFSEKDFTIAALRAIDQLKSFINNP
ncbi:MAG: hypothetical protein JXB49_27750 [Bacteroidales bacterium]|nr:hypothetical protein [Bacteroidales bacterium]